MILKFFNVHRNISGLFFRVVVSMKTVQYSFLSLSDTLPGR